MSHTEASVYERDKQRARNRITRLEGTLDESVELATRSLAMCAAAHARERRLIGMVEERDELIAELRHRITMLDLPSGWEGSD